MASCHVEHPDQLGVYCDRPAPSTGHAEHSGRLPDGSYTDWPNEDYLPPPAKPRGNSDRLAELAARVPPERRLARAEPEGAAQEAAKIYSRTRRKTRLGKVADHLLNHVGEWIDAAQFAEQEVGGFAGTRRLRELREEYGWPISTRKHPGKPNTWQHRLDHVPVLEDTSRG